MNTQLEFSFMIPEVPARRKRSCSRKRSKLRARIRMGVFDPQFLTEREVGGLCMPMGDGAQDAFDRDLMQTDYDYEGYGDYQ